MYSQYLKEGETPILTDTKHETGETVILTDSRVIHIKNSEVLYAEKYRSIGKLRFYDHTFSVVTDPREAVAVEVLQIVTTRYSSREYRDCYFAGFTHIAGIASALHIRCRRRGYDEHLCPEAQRMHKNQWNSLLITLAVFFLMLTVGFFLSLDDPSFSVVILLSLLVFFTGFFYVISLKGRVNKKEWNYRNELYGIHPNVNSKL